MNRFSGYLAVFSMLALAASSALAQTARVADTLDVEVHRVVSADSLVVAGAGTSQGVVPGSKTIIYKPFYYLNALCRNRVARGLVISSTDSTCQVRLNATTALVSHGDRVLIYGRLPVDLSPLTAERKRRPGDSKPFYRKKWFWPVVGGAAAVVAIIASTGGGGGGKTTKGTVTFSGRLP